MRLDPTPISRYQARRATLAERLAPGSLVIYPTAPEYIRNNDNHFPFRFDSGFYYLTGFPEPDAVLVQVTPAPERGIAGQHILFCRAKDELREIWEGFHYGPEAAREQFGFDACYAQSDFDEVFSKLVSHHKRLYYPIGASAAWDVRIQGLVQRVRDLVRSGVSAPSEFCDIRATVDNMRLLKDDDELALMRQAAALSTGAHRRAMQSAHPGQHEYHLEAELHHHFTAHGSRSPAYGSIVASGPNATCLHYRENARKMQAGDLVLIDAGCEWHGYASDITRTFPVSGRFSGPQRDVYQLVLAAMESAFATLRPGVPRIDYHHAAVRTLTAGLVDLKVLQGEVDGLIESGAYKQFYMHGTGHWLGLDVHDVGAYRPLEPSPADSRAAEDSQAKPPSRRLESGMVLTVEPGLYFRPLLPQGPPSHVPVPEHFLHLGVRIEDDVLITPDGYENLTAAAPKTVEAIEVTMRG